MSGEVLRFIYDLVIRKILKVHWVIDVLVILILGALIWKIAKELGRKERRKDGKSPIALSRVQITIDFFRDTNPEGIARRRTKSTKIIAGRRRKPAKIIARTRTNQPRLR